MKATPIFVALLVAILFVHAADAAKNPTPPGEMLFTLTRQNIISIKPGIDDISKTIDLLIEVEMASTAPGTDKIREAFDYNGGFQVLVPKKLFPIPAPHCKNDNIELLLRDTSGGVLYSNEQLDRRWRLFQSLNAVIEGKMASVDVKIAIMKFDKQGNPVLDWCHAEVQTESASEVAAGSAAYDKALSRKILFNLTRQTIASIKPGKDISRKMFDEEQGGDFEVSIPKALFPIAAPRCRDENVLLVTPVLTLTVANGVRNQKRFNQDRWKLFQSLHAVAEGKITRVEVSLELGVWMGGGRGFDQEGRPMLQRCHAHIDRNPSSGYLLFTPVP